MRKTISDLPNSTIIVFVSLIILYSCDYYSIKILQLISWRFDLFDYELYQILPVEFWAVLVIGSIAGIFAIKFSQSETRAVLAIVGLITLISICFLLGVFPAITGWDPFLHLSQPNYLIENGIIHPSNKYATQYPGATVFVALLSSISPSISSLTIGLIITIIINLGLAIQFMAIAKTFMPTKPAAYLSVIISTLTPAILVNNHFSYWLICYYMIWTFFLLLSILFKGQIQYSWRFITISNLILVAMVITHPILPLICFLFLGGFWFGKFLDDKEYLRIISWKVIWFIIIIVSWDIFIAVVYTEVATTSLQQFFLQSEEIVSGWSPVSLRYIIENGSNWSFSLNILRLLSYSGLGVAALFSLKFTGVKDKDVKLFYSLIAISTLIIPLGLVSSAPYVQRYLFFITPLLAYTGYIALYKFVSNRRKLILIQNYLSTMFLIICLIAGFFLWHPPSLIYSLHPSHVGYIVWPQEQKALEYVFNHVPDKKSVASDIQTMIAYSYLQQEINPFSNNISMGDNLREIVLTNSLLFDGDWIIRSKRQEIIAFIAQDLGLDFWYQLDITLITSSNRIYDNGFIVIYSTSE